VAAFTSFSAASYQARLRTPWACGTLANNSLVRFGYDKPVLEVAVPLGRLPSYHAAATAGMPTYSRLRQALPLAGSKLVLRHDLAFRGYARGPGAAKVFAFTNCSCQCTRGHDVIMSHAVRMDPELLWRPMFIPDWLG